mmetsp:Transcript_125864/g.218089  ORF Transcript_125864/g.218089 Transcript_125864/m.218089 type:complete len:200 (+) Transcript_125864:553-1152(+)
MPLYTTVRDDMLGTYTSSRPANSSFSSSGSILRRALKSCSSSASSTASGLSTTSCWIKGMFSRASLPSALGSTGTSRQPSTLKFAPFMTLSMASFIGLRFASSSGMKIWPTPQCASFPSSTTSCNRSQGTCAMMPAPSPDIPSARQPPRCSMQPTARMAFFRIPWDLSPLCCAMKPTPHPSRSSPSQGCGAHSPHQLLP